MSGVTGNLLIHMSESDFSRRRPARRTLLRRRLEAMIGDFIANSLVGLEIEGQLWVVSLNDDLGGLFDGLGTNATHDCGMGMVVEVGDVVALGSQSILDQRSWLCD